MRSEEKTAKQRKEYGAWYGVTGHLVLTVEAHGSRPHPQGEPGHQMWIRDASGKLIVLLSDYYAVMFRDACACPGAPDIGTARYHVYWDQQMLPVSALQFVFKPVPPAHPGGRGQGLTRVEALPAGTAIPFYAVVPGNEIEPLAFLTLLAIAGRWCGFSPSGHHKGLGRFRVEAPELIDLGAGLPVASEDGDGD